MIYLTCLHKNNDINFFIKGPSLNNFILPKNKIMCNNKMSIAIIITALVFFGFVTYTVFAQMKKRSLLSTNDFKRNERNTRKYQTTLTPINLNTNKVFENFQPTFQPTPLPPTYQNTFQNPKGKLSTFCQCSSISEQICADPATYVNSYNSGLTESSKFKDKNWSDIMPYDQYIKQPNYYKQNTEWADGMPYSIYYDEK